MAGLYGISAYQQTSQAYSKSTVNNDTKTQSTAKSDQTAATKGSQAKVETKGWSPIDTKSSLVPTKTEYGMTIGDVQLSDKAKDYLGKLQSKFHGMEFITVSKDMKAQVQQNAAAYGNANKMVVLIDEEKLERMATDESFRKKYEGIIASSQSKMMQAKMGLSTCACIACKLTTLDTCTDSYALIGVKALGRLVTCELFNLLNNAGNTC